jgi:hydroxymethylpyrimidine pyrophosphatase-like HAD family hydrolase
MIKYIASDMDGTLLGKNNDISMENAIPEIKEIAKYVTDTNYNSGVAKVIYKVLQGI